MAEQSWDGEAAPVFLCGIHSSSLSPRCCPSSPSSGPSTVQGLHQVLRCGPPSGCTSKPSGLRCKAPKPIWQPTPIKAEPWDENLVIPCAHQVWASAAFPCSPLSLSKWVFLEGWWGRRPPQRRLPLMVMFVSLTGSLLDADFSSSSHTLLFILGLSGLVDLIWSRE